MQSIRTGLLLPALAAILLARADGQGNPPERVSNDPDLPRMTTAMLDRLVRGLQTEIALRNDFKKLLAGYKTLEQYQACSNQTAGTPQAQKIMMQLGNLPEKCNRSRSATSHREDEH